MVPAEHYAPILPTSASRSPMSHNQRYNPRGTYQASEYVFPYEDSGVRLRLFSPPCLPTCCPRKSIITSPRSPGCSSRAVDASSLTFLLNEESLGPDQGTAGAHTTSGFGSGVHRFADPERPEFAVAYDDEGHILGLYGKHGLTLTGPPGYGSWCGRKEFLSYHNILVAEKDRQMA